MEVIIAFIKAIRRLLLKSINYCRLIIIKKVVADYKGHIYIGGKVKLTSNTYLGENVNFNGLIIYGLGKVVIGNNFHSGVECMFITSVHNYDQGRQIPYDSSPKADIHKDIIIGDNVWLGSRVIILGGVTIGEGAIIQAGAVVVKDIPKCGIAGGSPAKIFKYRDIEHYEKLKLENKFW